MWEDSLVKMIVAAGALRGGRVALWRMISMLDVGSRIVWFSMTEKPVATLLAQG